MKDGDIIVIDSVQVAELDGKEHRLVTDKAGNEYKFKAGRGGHLKEKWPLLEANIGKAIRLKVEEFKGYPFIADFEIVKDVFVQEAAAKVQPSGDREASIESQVCLKCACEIAKEGDSIEKILSYAEEMRQWIRHTSKISSNIDHGKEIEDAAKRMKVASQKLAGRPDVEEGIPKNKVELLHWVAEVRGFGSAATAQNYLLDPKGCNISLERINDDPKGVYEEVKNMISKS